MKPYVLKIDENIYLSINELIKSEKLGGQSPPSPPLLPKYALDIYMHIGILMYIMAKVLLKATRIAKKK